MLMVVEVVGAAAGVTVVVAAVTSAAIAVVVCFLGGCYLFVCISLVRCLICYFGWFLDGLTGRQTA